MLAQRADPSPRGAVTRGEGRRVLAASTPPLPLGEEGWGVGAGAEGLVASPPPASRGPDLITAPPGTPLHPLSPRLAPTWPLCKLLYPSLPRCRPYRKPLLEEWEPWKGVLVSPAAADTPAPRPCPSSSSFQASPSAPPRSWPNAGRDPVGMGGCSGQWADGAVEGPGGAGPLRRAGWGPGAELALRWTAGDRG